jgi:hypothetical protein
MKWKGIRRKLEYPNFKVLSRNSPGITERNQEKPYEG